MKYKLSAKRNDKWWNYGSFATNKFDKLQASFKVTPELMELIKENEGKWINFAAFEDKPYEKKELDDALGF